MSIYAQHLSTVVTPQSEPIPGEPQEKNNAGGYVYVITPWQQLERFLCIGSASGTYYVGERTLTQANAAVVRQCLDEDYPRVIERICAISQEGRAPSNDPAVAALAIAAAHPRKEARTLALSHLADVCRIPTHLFHFCAIVKGLRGHGRALNAALGQWYTRKSAEDFAFHALKYQHRDGWSNRDVLRLARPKMPTPEHLAIQHWIYTGERGEGEVFAQIQAAHTLHSTACTPTQAATLIIAHRLTHEMLPTSLLTSPVVWDALLDHMPMGAMLRNLGTMSRVGLLTEMSEAARTVCSRLRDVERLKRARLHPLTLLVALKTYAQGKGVKGQHTWTPIRSVIDALDAAFYLSFGTVEPTGKRLLLALDVSGSMGNAAGGLPLTCREVTAAMALVTANVEPQYEIVGFCDTLRPLAIAPRQRLDDVVRTISGLPFGGTDCALPMLYAMQHRRKYEAFLVFTDNETWRGSSHPIQALRQYRQQSDIAAKLAVQAIVLTAFSIADPLDPLTLDLSGFDTATPQVLSWFLRS